MPNATIKADKIQVAICLVRRALQDLITVAGGFHGWAQWTSKLLIEIFIFNVTWVPVLKLMKVLASGGQLSSWVWLVGFLLALTIVLLFETRVFIHQEKADSVFRLQGLGAKILCYLLTVIIFIAFFIGMYFMFALLAPVRPDV